jgi:hypothetical protein
VWTRVFQTASSGVMSGDRRALTRVLTNRLLCITNEYMTTSKAMAVRIEPELLLQLRNEARNNRRSLSAQILFMVRKELEQSRCQFEKPRPTMGWLAHLEAPENIDDYREVRSRLSGALTARTGRSQR